MAEVVNWTWKMVGDQVDRIGQGIKDLCSPTGYYSKRKNTLSIYPIPNGGIPVGVAIIGNWFLKHFSPLETPTLSIVENPKDADIFIDDIIDSGKTKQHYLRKYGTYLPFFALVDKTGGNNAWVVFPWERMAKEDGPQDNIRRIIQFIGDDPQRAGLLETPDRVVRSYSEIFAGYNQDPATVIKTFDEPASDEMVIARGLEFYSVCEHHMQPFFGSADIAYIPKDGKVIGVSKLARILDIFSRRLQIQERLTKQITTALDDHLQPMGSACRISAKHFCMMCRGVNKQHSQMITSSLTGVFREKPEARAEFLSLIRGD